MSRFRLAVVGLLTASFVSYAPAAQAAGSVNVGNFSQCANGQSPSTSLACTGWINGAIQSSNSHYGEDQVVPQRLRLTLPADTSSHTLTIQYQTRKSGIHAYDSLATWNKTQTAADACQGITASICAGSPSTFPMATDSTAVNPAGPGVSPITSNHELPQADRQWTLYGGTITAVGAVTHSNAASASGDDTATVSVTFQNSNSTAKEAVLLFGGHLSVGATGTILRNWGPGLGASSVSGGPYSIAMGSIDGSAVGNMSNTIQASGITPVPPAKFAISKSATPAAASPGQLVTYTVKVTNTGGQDGSTTFKDDFADSISPSAVTADGTGGSCTKTTTGNLLLNCTTGTIAPGATQTFTYTATMPTTFSGTSGGGGCTTGSYPIANTATLASGVSATFTVCVGATPTFTVTKSADITAADPGQKVTYTVTVTNNGSTDGSTTFKDDFADSINPSAVVSDPTGGSCTKTTTGNLLLDCTTGTIPAGGHQTFTYSATMPLAFTGDSGGGTCDTGSYPIENGVTLSGGATAGVTVCVASAPAFSVTKTVDTPTAAPGQVVKYTITVKNTGTSAGGTTFTDDHSDRVTPSAVVLDPTGGSCTEDTTGDDVLNCTTGTIPAGGQQTFTYTAAMPDTFTGLSGTGGCDLGEYPIRNSVTITGGASDSATVCVPAAATFTISKKADPETATPGESVHYTVTVKNTGTTDGSTTFVDNYNDRIDPSAVTGGTCTKDTTGDDVLNCTTGTIAAGDHQTFEYDATMPATFSGASGGSGCAAGSYPIGNRATLDGGAHADATVCVAASADFTIKKTVDHATVDPGQPVTYTITVTNNGSSAASTTFVDDYSDRVNPSLVTSDPDGASCVKDTTGNDVLNCTTGTIEAGGHQTFTYTADMPTTFTGTSGGGSCTAGQFPISNTATITDGPSADATVCVTAAPAFTVTKAADDLTAEPGQVVKYTITVKNTGAADGKTTFVDNYDDQIVPGAVGSDPSGGTCTPDTTGDAVLRCETSIIASGDSQVFTYTAKMPLAFSGASGGGTCATGSYPIVNTVTLANSSMQKVTVCVAAAPKFTISKSADDLTASPGQVVNYTITVANTGSAGGDTTFTDDFADSIDPSAVVSDPNTGSCVESGTTNRVLDCTTGTIAAGESQTFTYAATMPASFSGDSGGTPCTTGSYPVSNTAAIDQGDSDSVTVCVAAAPNFTITKTADDDFADPGQVVNYTVKVKNVGDAGGHTTFIDDYNDRITPSAVTSDPTGGTCTNNTTDNDELECTTGTIAAGETQTFTYSATMPATFSGETGGAGCPTGTYPITNVATIHDGPSSDATVCIGAAPKFTITKTADDLTADPGQVVTYTVTVDNNGTTSGDTTFKDDFADSINPSAVVSDPTGGSCTETTTGNLLLDCTTGTIEAGGSQTFTYTAAMPSTFTGDSGGSGCATGTYPIDNTATLANGAADDVTVCVAAAPTFKVTKTVDDTTAEPGQVVKYTITVDNTGKAAGATTFTDDFTDTINPSAVDSDPNTGSCAESGTTNRVLDCSTGTIAAGGHQTFTYTAAMPTTFEGDSGGGDCPTGTYPVVNSVLVDGGASDAATVCVTAAPEFSVTKKADTTSATPGQVITYTITVSNTGEVAGSTTFVDDYNDRITPSAVTSVPDTGSCVNDTSGNDVLRCTTGAIAIGGHQTFTYTAAMPGTYEGDSGGSDCSTGTYPVINTVTLDNTSMQGVTVCVTAAPKFTVTKSADDATAMPGQKVKYTVTVNNTGAVAGGTTFTDDYNDRLTPSAVTTDPSGGTCTVNTTGNDVLNCTTGSIAPGGHQTFTYTADMPATFTGAAGGSGCASGEFPIGNTVTLANNAAQTVTVCVAAAPSLHLDKSVTSRFDNSGDQFLTYTITYSNTGAAEAVTADITDAIPAGTAFSSCTNGCSTTGMTISSAGWSVGPVAPLTGSGSVTLVVKVTSNKTCQISNTAQISTGGGTPVPSNTVVVNVSPRPDFTGAHANGSAKGAQVITSGLLNLLVPANNQALSSASTSQTGLGGPVLDSDALLTAKVPGNGSLITASAINTTSASVVGSAPAAAHQTSTAEVAKVCLLPVAGICTVETGTVRAVASTEATGGSASNSAAGSTIQNLKIVGLATPVDLNQTTKIPLSKAIFGANSYVAINERSGPGGQPVAGLSGGKYVADLTVTMIHVKITGVLGLQAAEIIVAQATAHSDFPQTFVCAPGATRSLSGHSFVASLSTGPLLADLVQGYTQIAPLGGSETEQIAALKVPASGSIVNADVADSSSNASISSTQSTSDSVAEIAGNGTKPACVLKTGTICVAEATVIRAESHTIAKSTGAVSNDSGTTIAGLKVLGTVVTASALATPNSTITLPGIGFIVLNEQFCDNGALASHTCTGTSHSGLTVRGIRVVVTAAANLLGLTPGIELIVAEAHSDATYS